MLLDVEEGHFLATFKLAKDLRDRGHEVSYLGLGSAERLVRQQGFDFAPVLDDMLDGTRVANVPGVSFGTLVTAVLRGRLDGVIERLRPDGLVLLSLYYLEALLVARRYRLPVVLLTPQYRFEPRARTMELAVSAHLLAMGADLAREVIALAAGEGGLRSFRDLVDLLLPIPELVLLPREFDLPQLARDPDVTYVGGGVDLARAEEPFPWEALDGRLPLVYCSLGSQADLQPEAARGFFRCVAEAAAARPDLQFVLSTGKGFAPADFPACPPNLYRSDWVPQLTVLGRAGAMVNHAGAGTVKECIVKGVPMVVLPLMRDQFDCARRVVYHGLGVEGDLKHLTAASLLSNLDAVMGDPGFRQRVGAMRECFLRADAAGLGARRVEEAITGGEAPVPGPPQVGRRDLDGGAGPGYAGGS